MNNNKKNLLLCLTGSVASKLLYKLYQAFESDYNIQIIVTKSAEYFIWNTNRKNVDFIHKKRFLNPHPITDDLTNIEQTFQFDQDHFIWTEFHGTLYREHYHYETTDNIAYFIYNKVVHIELANWADVILIAPCTANTLGKLANGVCDNLLTSTITAVMGMNKQIFIAPAMNTNMYNNNIVQNNINILKKQDITFIEPTVDKLACDDFGIGALPYVGTIANIVNGHRWFLPIDFYNLNNYRDSMIPINEQYDCDTRKFSFKYFLPTHKEPGSFGFQRKFEIHNGVDIYCAENSPVHAVEDGEVVAIKQFTGKQLNMDWWLDTWAMCVKGQSGVVCYGEMNQQFNFNVGDKIKGNDVLGTVKAVLPTEKIRPDIRNHNNAMLHIQLFKDYENDEQLLNWYPNQQRNKMLLDPTPYLKFIN